MIIIYCTYFISDTPFVGGDKATTEFKFEPYAPPPPRPLQVASKASDVAPDSVPHTEKRDLTTPESEIPKSQVK